MIVPAFLALAQATKTLDAFLATHPSESTLVVSPEKARALTTGATLADYKRKLVKVGGINAIVPITMVQFDDSLAKPANLYDGLPRQAKVMYLMTTLTAPQWRQAATTGLGLASLTNDQKAVFLSILPPTLKWTQSHVDKEGMLGETIATGTLDEKSILGLKLKLEKRLTLETPLAGSESSYTMHYTDEESGKKGGTAYRRDNSDDSDRNDTFGVEFRKTVPNLLKKGQLDTSALNAAVTLPTKTTVGQALKAASAATGREILADARIQGRIVTWNGGKIRAGDLLDSLSLAVTGTYRRVGSAYLLCADITGIGARKLKLSLWENDLRSSVYRREGEWRAAIAKTGVSDVVGYDPEGELNPGPDLIPRLRNNPIGKPYEPPYSTDLLTPALRGFLDRINSRTTTQKIRTDKIKVDSEMGYLFVLPNGNPLQIEGQLGEDWQFLPGPTSSPDRPEPANPRSKIPPKLARLSIRTDSPAEANQAAKLAELYGFSELWIETERAEALSAALTGPLPVRLVIRPWRLATPSSLSDRNIFGDTGLGVVKRLAETTEWQENAKHWKMQTYPRWPSLALTGDVMSPFDPSWSNRVTTVLALARTPKLAGIVVTDSLPHGYEMIDDNSQVGGYSRQLVELWALGYSPEARLAFIHAKGVDPIDLCSESVRFSVDLDPPFFTDWYDGQDNPVPTRSTLLIDWMKFRGETNARAIKSLLNALPELPIVTDLRAESITQPLRRQNILVPWTRGGDFATYHEQFPPDVPGATALLVAPNIRDVEPLDDFANGIRFLVAKIPVPFALDLSEIPPAQWKNFLTRILEMPDGSNRG